MVIVLCKNVLIIPIRKTYTRFIFQLIQTVKYTSLSKRFVCYFSTSIFNRLIYFPIFVRSFLLAPLPFRFLFKNILFVAFVLCVFFFLLLFTITLAFFHFFGQAFLFRLLRVYHLTSDSEDVSHYTVYTAVQLYMLCVDCSFVRMFPFSTFHNFEANFCFAIWFRCCLVDWRL